MNEQRMMNVLLAPHLSEKSVLAGQGYPSYAFKVAKDATKPEIKQAVEKLFNVTVKNVRVLNVRKKSTRFGRIEGRTAAWKKAYVTLTEGEIQVG